MPDIYNIGPAPKLPTASGGVGYSLRSNAYATISALGGPPDSPLLATGGGSGRPVTTLNYVKATLEGTAGSLRRSEFQVTAYEVSDFDALLTQFKVGKEIEITIGRNGPGAGGGIKFKSVIYKQAFQSSKDGKYTLTCSGVGKGMEALRDSAFGLPKNATKNFYRLGKLFDILPWQEEVPVTNLIDYLLWEALENSGATDLFTLSAESGTGILGQYVEFIAPTGLAQGTAPESNIGPTGRIVYFTFSHIMKYVNQSLKDNNRKPIDFSKAVVNMRVAGKCPLISGDPLNVLFPRSDGESDYSPEGTPSVKSELIKNLLGKPTSIFTQNAQCNHMSGEQASCGDILISYACLKTIQTNLSTNSSTDPAEDPVGTTMNLNGFFESLFSIISEASGGWCDLALLEEPSIVEDVEAPLIIINKKSKNPSGGIARYDDISGEGGVREASIQGDVPSAWQQEAFAKGSIANDSPTVKFTFTNWNQARAALTQAGFDPAQAEGIKSKLREAVASLTPDEAKDVTDRPYPIGLSLTVNGVPGVKFGQALDIQSIQSTRWAKNTAFTVTRVDHMVQNQDWTTEITTVARLVPV